jgi:phosphoglycolate phosphatase
MSDKHTLLFDFDGTIADTLGIGIEIVNKYSGKFGYRKIQEEEIERLKGLTPWQLLKEFKIPFYKLPFMLSVLQSELYKNIANVKPIKELPSVLHALHDQHYVMGIITSNSEKNVRTFLKAHDLEIFDFIHNERNIFGKFHTINKVLQQNKLQKNDVIYVGDEVRDIEACNKSGIDMIAVSWGFNTKVILSKFKPKHLIDSPKELLEVLKS